MAKNTLKKLSEKLNKSQDAAKFKLSQEERKALGSTLDTFIDHMGAGHQSSHQNNHTSHPPVKMEQ